MAHIGFAWEIGGGLGHLANMLPVAEALRGRGHALDFALHDTTYAATMLGSRGFSYSKARAVQSSLNFAPASYAEMLLSCGYASVAVLRPLVAYWREWLMGATQGLLIADHAPTALLAARGLPIARAMLGAGFFSPPRTTPLPRFRDWEPVDERRIADSERRVLDTINTVLAEHGTAPLTRLADLFDLDCDLLCTWPELDHYPARKPGTDYLGPILMRDSGATPAWPQANGPRIFAYLKGNYAGLMPVVEALRASGIAASIYLQNGSDEQYRLLTGPKLHCQREPIALNDALAQADLVICHAGHSTVAATLLAGKPLLLLPMHAEQYIVSQRVAALGAGLCHVPGFQPLDLPSALRQLVNKPDFRECASRFAARHTAFDPSQQSELLADRLEAVLAPSCGK